MSYAARGRSLEHCQEDNLDEAAAFAIALRNAIIPISLPRSGFVQAGFWEITPSILDSDVETSISERPNDLSITALPFSNRERVLGTVAFTK